MSRQILLGLILGIAAGWAINRLALPPARAARWADYLQIFGDIFIRLIKMIIAPLVLATLVSGIVQLRAGASVGRMLGRTIGWFLLASVVSLCLGLVMVNLFAPGSGVELPPPLPASASSLPAAGLTLRTFVEHAVPVSIARAMADNEVLQIVVFAVFAGAGMIAIGDRARPLIDVLDALVHLMLKIAGYVTRLAPYAVFAAIASVVAVYGLQIIVTFARFAGSFYLSLALLWLILLSVGVAALGPAALLRLAREVREPFLISLATASSEASYPQLLDALRRAGLKPQVVSFVLPLGYSFNLDGSMMYCIFACLFIAQAYGVELSALQQVMLMLLLLVSSKGIAGVPRASLVVVAATLPYFDIPASGLLVIIAVDHFLDMGRTATNVIGNAVAAAVIDKWETRTATAITSSMPAHVHSES